MKNLKLLSILLLVAVLMVGINTPTYAHKMIINPIEPGKVKIEYDGGNPATRSKVTAYNSEDEVVIEGDVDEEGIFEFDEKEVAYLEADDGMGHKDTWEVGVEVDAAGGSKLLKIGAVVVVLGAIAFFFTRKK